MVIVISVVVLILIVAGVVTGICCAKKNCKKSDVAEAELPLTKV